MSLPHKSASITDAQSLNMTLDELTLHKDYSSIAMRQIIDDIGFSIVITDKTGHVLYANQFAINQTKLPDHPQLGKLDPLLDENLIGAHNKSIILTSLHKNKRWQFDHKINLHNGLNMWENVSMLGSIDSNDELCNIVISRRDITDERYSLEQLAYTARYDRLTKLANKYHAVEQLQQKLSNPISDKANLALFIIDIDNFHILNEAHGYDIGDNLLKAIATRLTTNLTDMWLIGRLSGDKFICVHDNLPESNNVLDYIETIQRVFDQEFDFPDRSILLSVCIGVAFSAQLTDAVQLLRDADSAMHQANLLGKNSYAIFDQQLKENVLRKAQIEVAMRSAIDNNELQVFFQPIVDSTTQQIICAEALLRWHSSVLGTISPTEFIPIAEQSGQIVKIGAWVLEKVCLQVAHWRKMGVTTYACVNVSAIQLIEHYQFHETFFNLLQSNQLTVADIELEVTESLMLDNDERHRDTLQKLIDANCRFAIDDFGTGFSSLKTLSKFKFHKLKIDKSFIQNVLTSKRDRLVTEAIVQIAKTLDMQITAEGVETDQMLAFCQGLGCDLIQGYLFYKPISSNDFFDLIHRIKLN